MKNANFLRYVRGEKAEDGCRRHYAWNIRDYGNEGYTIKTRKYFNNADFLDMLITIVGNMEKAGYDISDIDVKISFAKKIENSNKDFVQIVNIDSRAD